MEVNRGDLQLSQIESFCETYMTSSNQTERSQVEVVLGPFSTNPDLLGQLKLILEKSNSIYALNFAASSIQRLLATRWNSFTKESRAELSKELY
jgi:hypothetical protein